MTFFFSNSNLDTSEEFVRREAALRQLAAVDKLDVIVDEYRHQDWLERVARGFESEPERGARCTRCFRYNLARAATYAAEHGYDAFTTSLTVSPHKPTPVIFAVGSAFPQFLPVDFKKQDGFLCSVRRAKELGLYRQNYCGCEFSKCGKR